MRRKMMIFMIVFLFSIVAIPAFGWEEQRTPLLDSWEQYMTMKKASPFDLKWVLIGPTMNSARVETLQAHPAQPGTMYVAFGSGHLWKTTNHGLTWESIFENQSAPGIGDICLAPSNPDIIWLGSGVSLKKPRNFTLPGTGVFRSNDGGETWRNTGLHDSYHIGEIVVHPENPDVVFVAVMGHFWSTNVNRGLYRTIDGGKTWEHVLYVNERTGANDVVIAPSNPDVIYVSMWENNMEFIRGSRWESNPRVYGKESGVYRSSDGGDTWTRLNGGFPDGPKTGRIGLAVSWSSPDKVYALVDNLNDGVSSAAEVYRTVDGGESWERTHKADLQIFSRIGWYFADCYVNPKNDEEVFALGIRIAHSTDGGRTFDLIGGKVMHIVPNRAEPLHLDHCELWIDPSNPSHLAVGNDGGLYVSYDKGKTWLHYNNIPTGEFYDIAVDDQDPYLIYGGTQDDSSVYGPAREWRPQFADGWKYVWLDAWSGGDGCYTIPDPTDPSTVYYSAQHNALRRKDLSTGRSVRISPRFPRGQDVKTAYLFIAPYILSPHDPRTLYHAGNFVFKSRDRGESWKPVSPDLSRSADETKTSVAAGAIAESPLEAGTLYVGTDRGAFWVTRDDGVTWEERSQGLPSGYIRSICPSRFSASRVYVQVSGINYDDLAKYLYVSEDDGKSWTSIASGLPDEVVNCVLEDPTSENILYAGTLRGVFVSVDRGNSWSVLGPDMPSASIADLVIQEREMDLIAATHGRGIFIVNVRPIQTAVEKGIHGEPFLFETPVARLPWVNDSHRDFRAATAETIPITIFLPEAAEVQVSVREKNDNEPIWTTRLEARRGFNQLRWDLITKRVESPEAYFYRYNEYIPRGAYEIQVSGEGIDLRGELRVLDRKSPD